MGTRQGRPEPARPSGTQRPVELLRPDLRQEIGVWGPESQGRLRKSRDITLPTEVHLIEAMVFPVVMYGCES